jgi:hypothetical protein
MSATNKADVSAEKTDGAHDLRWVPLSVISGTLGGAIIGAGIIGYLQLSQGFSESQETGIIWLIIEVIVGGMGGAIAGTAVGLFTGLILVGRNGSGKRLRLR